MRCSCCVLAPQCSDVDHAVECVEQRVVVRDEEQRRGVALGLFHEQRQDVARCGWVEISRMEP